MNTARHRSRDGATAARLVVVAALVVSGCTPPSPPQAQEPTPALRHCVYTGHDVFGLAALEPVLGTTPDCALVFNNTAKTWEQWSTPWFITHGDPRYHWDEWVRGSGGAHRLIVSQSLIPTDVPDDWRARGARGEYDEHAKDLARSLVKAGLGSATMRLAAEANGTWNHDAIGDGATQRADWARFWARTVKAMRTVPGAQFTFDWSVNAAVRPVPFHQYYPGDDVVDVIGIDQYDALPGSSARGAERWRQLRTQPAGLDALATFAEQRGKPISVPEAGLVSSDDHGAGDNPAYVEGLRDFLARRPSDYVAYFDKNAEGVLRLNQVPDSARVWRDWVQQGGSS